METLEEAEKSIEEVVGRKGSRELNSVEYCGLEDPAGVDDTPADTDLDLQISWQPLTCLDITQMGVKTTSTASLALQYLAYLNSLASSSRGSPQSWTMRTRVPILTK